jgi:hypothetical protein
MTDKTPERLRVGSAGRVRGALFSGDTITWNDPFPTKNGDYGSGAMMGVVMHTEVGFDHNVVNEFNEIVSEASATFSIRTNGDLHQYGPIGKGWYAWAQEAGNEAWYSIEHEDGGDPTVPLTDAQMWTSAQLVEVLSAFAGFPLQVATSTTMKGYGAHYLGGAAWGGHTCPDVPPTRVRSLQRWEIVRRAMLVRTTPAT